MSFTQVQLDEYYNLAYATENKKIRITYSEDEYIVSVTSDLEIKTIDFLNVNNSNAVFGYVNEKGEWKKV
jgi:hypothetical protein